MAVHRAFLVQFAYSIYRAEENVRETDQVGIKEETFTDDCHIEIIALSWIVSIHEFHFGLNLFILHET